MQTSESPRSILAEALRRDAARHAAGQMTAIGEGYDDAESELLPLEESRERDVAIAFSFWDGWVDARNHDWKHYPGIAESDWPVLAHRIAAALQAGEPIIDSRILEHFAPENRKALWLRAKNWLRGAFSQQ